MKTQIQKVSGGLFKTVGFFAVLVLLSACRFYEVDKGRVYRSPQPSGPQLEEWIPKYGLKTIVNLRGENPGTKWWDTENEIAKKYGVELVNIPMSAGRLPHRKDLIKLLDTFRNAPMPMLIHCQAGVDRTGEASALYEMIYMNYSKEEALKMLSLSFGHVEKFKPAKIYFIKNVWVDENWARTSYDPCKADYQYYDKNNPECQVHAQDTWVPQNSELDLDGDT